MTQEEINILFSITITLHEHKFFGEGKRANREMVQEWVARQIAVMHEIYTVPCGSSWGVITTKDRYDKYWEEHSKL